MSTVKKSSKKKSSKKKSSKKNSSETESSKKRSPKIVPKHTAKNLPKPNKNFGIDLDKCANCPGCLLYFNFIHQVENTIQQNTSKSTTTELIVKLISNFVWKYGFTYEQIAVNIFKYRFKERVYLLKILVALGLDPNNLRIGGYKVLNQLVYENDILSIIALVENGANIDLERPQNNILHICASKNYPVLLKYALSRNEIEINAVNIDGSSPLYLACLYLNKECIKILLDNGADIEYQTPDEMTCCRELTNLLGYVMHDDPTVYNGIYNRHGDKYDNNIPELVRDIIDVLKLIISAKDNLSRREIYLIRNLCFNKPVIMNENILIDLFIFIVNKFPEIVYQKFNSLGHNAINMSIISCNNSLIKYFVDKTDLNFKNNINNSVPNPFQLLVNHGYVDYVKTILNRDPKIISTKCIFGHNLLHYAFMPCYVHSDIQHIKSNEDIIELVKLFAGSKKINLNHRNNFGYRAIETAIRYCHIDVIKELLKFNTSIFTENRIKQQLFPIFNNNDIISFATQLGRLDVVTYLIQENVQLQLYQIDDIHSIPTALLIAIAYHRKNFIKIFLELPQTIYCLNNIITKEYVINFANLYSNYNVQIIDNHNLNFIDKMSFTNRIDKMISFYSAHYGYSRILILSGLSLLLSFLEKICSTSKKSKNYRSSSHFKFLEIIIFKNDSHDFIFGRYFSNIDSEINLLNYMNDPRFVDNCIEMVGDLIEYPTVLDVYEYLMVINNYFVSNQSALDFIENLGLINKSNKIVKINKTINELLNKSEISIDLNDQDTYNYDDYIENDPEFNSDEFGSDEFSDEAIKDFFGLDNKNLLTEKITSPIKSVKNNQKEDPVKKINKYRVENMLHKFCRGEKLPHYDIIYKCLLETDYYQIFDNKIVVYNDKIILAVIYKLKSSDSPDSQLSYKPNVRTNPSYWIKSYSTNICSPNKQDLYHMFPFILDWILYNWSCVECQTKDKIYPNEFNTHLYFYGELNTNNRMIKGCFEYFLNCHKSLYHRLFHEIDRVPNQIQRQIAGN
ncbi:ankyrin repeat-containing protein [Acanthamoeba polyphaga mimivirus]|uniref:Ankyrin repeat-containing protein n=1 Tax=Acanthamoeba polyphaga mimivirus Kroon TaxID=3069720 RepID=A0A0G2Y274_9VIRU|nr:ankyrin repeat-containing protein [Acanthamoeba polyphaga mimivirus]AKI79833.1 ankyrin repeat-containing protein [Acanthamoeba polyphaga mimivirus Kroon]